MIKAMGDDDDEKTPDVKPDPVKNSNLVKFDEFEKKLGKFYKNYEVIDCIIEF
jgi:hypothetical protein